MVEQVKKEEWTKSFEEGDGPSRGGRQYHGVKDSSYWLPKDEDEQLRLTGGHFAAKEMFDGNVDPEILKHISFEDGIKAMDIGCGAGAFVMDMAVEYPKTFFHGVDIAAMFDHQMKLPNVEFSIGNVLTGLPFPDNTFDFIQMRLFVAALRKHEWPIAVAEVKRLLKPGGFIQLCEYIPRETGNESCRTLKRAVAQIMDDHDQDSLSGEHIKGWIEKAGMELVSEVEKTADLGDGTKYAEKWQWAWEHSCRSMYPLLGPALGASLEERDSFLQDHIKEMVKSHGIIYFIRATGRKPLE